MIGPRYLLVTADDFGVGPDTSRGILDLAARGVLTSTVLLVTSPFATEGVAQWRKAGCPLELGWHPCLTLDKPILPAAWIPSLVGTDGMFPPLGSFLKRLVRGQIDRGEVEAELRAQYRRFVDLVGHPPMNVNGHHHVHIFSPIREALQAILADTIPRPYVRRVVEPWRTLVAVKGARIKRAILARFGRRSATRQAAAEFPGADWLIGITDPPYVRDPAFFTRWLGATPGRYVELTCHPGHLDATLAGRDGSLIDGQLHRRAHEFDRLSHPSFTDAVRAAGFTLVTAESLGQLQHGTTPVPVRRAG